MGVYVGRSTMGILGAGLSVAGARRTPLAPAPGQRTSTESENAKNANMEGQSPKTMLRKQRRGALELVEFHVRGSKAL